MRARTLERVEGERGMGVEWGEGESAGERDLIPTQLCHFQLKHLKLHLGTLLLLLCARAPLPLPLRLRLPLLHQHRQRWLLQRPAHLQQPPTSSASLDLEIAHVTVPPPFDLEIGC